jgi:hypothetical protein
MVPGLHREGQDEGAQRHRFASTWSHVVPQMQGDDSGGVRGPPPADVAQRGGAVLLVCIHMGSIWCQLCVLRAARPHGSHMVSALSCEGQLALPRSVHVTVRIASLAGQQGRAHMGPTWYQLLLTGSWLCPHVPMWRPGLPGSCWEAGLHPHGTHMVPALAQHMGRTWRCCLWVLRVDMHSCPFKCLHGLGRSVFWYQTWVQSHGGPVFHVTAML